MPRTPFRCDRRLCAAGVTLLMLTVLLPMLMLMTGCEKGSAPSAFVVYNRSGDPLDHLVITDAGPVLNYPKLEKGERMARKLPGNAELPRVVNVYWKCLDGRSHHQKIEVWKRVSSGYHGPVLLTLERSGSIRVTTTSSL
ncbi:MAG: hypothetical protein AAGH92_10740 [Planctomycetota bacterium]